MNLVDTHCHIHDAQYEWPKDVLDKARENGVTKMITVGTSISDSKAAIEYARKHEDVFAVIGIHPSGDESVQASDVDDLETLIQQEKSTGKLVGFGDIGLDYHYKPYNRAKQIKSLEGQLGLAVKYDLPVSFHVRDAYEDFWPFFDNFNKLRGALHCYTGNLENMKKALERGLYVSINGIVTFNKDSELNKVFEQIPTERILFETDAPYLAPKPFRGKTNQPAYIFNICEAFSKMRGLDMETIAKISSQNVADLFEI